MNDLPTRNAPIGVFDSGLGGLSVLHELVQRLPQEDFIYVADSGHCPYGGKAREAIVERAITITEFLRGEGAKLVVIACNAATYAAAEILRARYPSPFVGMEPAVKPAVAATHSGVVGVLTTSVTASGDRLQRLIRDYARDVRVITQPCPGLVEQVEAGELDGTTTHSLLRRFTAPLLSGGADTLVLGCTHYPFLRPQIVDIVGPQVALIDTGAAVARRTAALLAEDDLANAAGHPGTLRWYSSGDPAIMEAIGSRLWGQPLAAVALPAAISTNG